MMISLPQADGGFKDYRLSGKHVSLRTGPRKWNRRVYAAAHVVANPHATSSPWIDGSVDWAATEAFRDYLWGLGFGIAEAMDTAQRGMGLNWLATQQLIERSLTNARGRSIAIGVGTDQLTDTDPSLDAVRDAYLEQLDFVDSRGGQSILMASRGLCAAAKGPDDYLKIYGELIGQAGQPVILHWLGEAFDPKLKGYWGSHDADTATATVLNLIRDNAAKVDGIKISLLDADMEIAFRRQLPDGVHLFTGDDFNYPQLIAGDEVGFSDALLGVFDPIAPVAASALDRLADGDTSGFLEQMNPTLDFARHIFQSPTQFYKSGVVFLAWLNGHQDHFTMLGGLQSARSPVHYAKLFELADIAGLFIDPEKARHRMRAYLTVSSAAA